MPLDREAVLRKLAEIKMIREQYLAVSPGKRNYKLGWMQGYMDALQWVLERLDE